ncbi:flavohemoglobin expression-modulating QEGLA motif protein [Fulvimonas sp. R45]|uniref:flavohemoglobin expression-modulating QEGLA motif protein n=1 Tax=Fulvimonas sp. R45 TaxID=3045937 RepID=UPI0026603FE0|nr:flavohemoglobin expression-modulating QEGLA motif protein [Fulvimonas sp. R45]MDO1527555.1 flavohemoglobin expression-modulating QEGLA motif protein [Fulvimonas sp. R45]
MSVAPALQRYADLDRRLLAAVKGIHILPTVAWPASLENRLIADYAEGRHTLPRVDYARPDLAGARAELAAIERTADDGDPLGDYLRRTAESWRIAAEMLEAVGGAGVTAPSIALYGRPGDPIPGSARSNLDAARYFVELSDELGADLLADDVSVDIPAAGLRDELATTLDGFFGPGVIVVEVDPELTAKAAAGATRIRLRANTCFSEYDRHQLLAHEAFVHSLTALNGREQPLLASLARTSPRVTATQEGLAVFAELMSGAIDIARLKRISLRILAIDMALSGADFVEVYRFFHERGQSVADSFHSAQRVFRGVPTTGGAAFAKDNVYLSGLLDVHTFFRWAFREQRMDLLRYLFAGKLALADVLSLEPHFASGALAPPRWLPPWMRHAHGLAGKLAFSVFVNGIRMGRVGPDDLLREPPATA